MKKIFLIALTMFATSPALAVDFSITFQPDAAALSSAVSVGTVIAYSAASVPANWLLADGSSVLKATYPAYSALIACTYGCADATHFNLPNYTGMFLRGSGAQGYGGVTYDGGSVPRTQMDSLQNHNQYKNSNGTSEYDLNANGASGNSWPSGGAGLSSSSTGGYVNNARTSGDTRPGNVTVNYIVKVL